MMEYTGSDGRPALTDPQTGLPNALHWDTFFEVIFASGQRGLPLTLLFLDIDDLQEFLSRRGIQEADGVFELLGETIRAKTRQSDLITRVGEERFAFLLLDCNLDGGRLVADRLDMALGPVRDVSGLSFSMGAAGYDREMNAPQELVKVAEDALRTARRRGMNQIEIGV
jgi:diguanylate cyclase (GGDEF)-like protein